MNIAGVLVCTTPEDLDQVRNRLNAMPGVDVHHEESNGRILITIEGRDTDEDVARLKRVKAIDAVQSADMIEYHFGDSAVEADKFASGHIPEELLADDHKSAVSFYQQIKTVGNA